MAQISVVRHEKDSRPPRDGGGPDSRKVSRVLCLIPKTPINAVILS